MLQRIGLAQALIHEPPLIVLDEPTAGVDPAGARDIRDLLLDLKRRGMTILLSSHLLSQVQEDAPTPLPIVSELKDVSVLADGASLEREPGSGLDGVSGEASGPHRALVIGALAAAEAPRTNTDVLPGGEGGDDVVGTDEGDVRVERCGERLGGDLGADPARIAEAHGHAGHGDSVRIST